MILEGVSDRTRVRMARVMVGTALALAVVAVVLYVIEGEASRLVEDWILHNVLVTVSLAGVAWLALPGRARNGALWALVWASAFGALTAFGAAVGLTQTRIVSSDIEAGLVTVAPADLDTIGALGFLLARALWVPSLFLILTLGLLLFPDGALPSPRWKWVARGSVSAITVLTLAFAWAVRPWSSDLYLSADSENAGQFIGVMLLLVLLSVLACVAGLVLRFRRSSGETRQQFRWVTWGFAVFGIVTVVLLPVDSDLFKIVGLFAIVLLGVSYGVAITRYRLYEIDVVINCSLVFALLAGFITGVYALVVVGIGSWIGAGASSLPLSIAATALVAVVFEPVRDRVQRVANRLVYGARATPYQVLADLTARLGSAESMDGLLGRMVQRLAEGTGAVRATLRLEGEDAPAAIWPPGSEGDGSGDGEFTVSVVGGGETLGSVSVRKARGESLTPTERGLVEDLAGSAAMVLNRARLGGDLAARAEDLRVSRRRLVDAQGDQRRRLERDLHDGAQQQIVALKVKLGLVGRFADQERSEDTAVLIDQMAEDAQHAIDEIRSLAKGIFPPLLQREGLGAAVTAGAANAPVPIIVDALTLSRFAPEVEAATYFAVSEAITNAVKHSGAQRIEVRLGNGRGGLAFLVRDEGCRLRCRAVQRRQRPRRNARSPRSAGRVALLDIVPGCRRHGRRLRSRGPNALTQPGGRTSRRVSGPRSDFPMNATAPAARARGSYSTASCVESTRTVTSGWCSEI